MPPNGNALERRRRWRNGAASALRVRAPGGLGLLLGPGWACACGAPKLLRGRGTGATGGGGAAETDAADDAAGPVALLEPDSPIAHSGREDLEGRMSPAPSLLANAEGDRGRDWLPSQGTLLPVSEQGLVPANIAPPDWLACFCALTSSHHDVAPCGRDLESAEFAATGDEQAAGDALAAPDGDEAAAADTPIGSSNGSGLSKRFVPLLLLLAPPPAGVVGASRGRLTPSCSSDLDRDATPRGDGCGVPGPLMAVAGEGADALAAAALGPAGC
mmetsp:Transcript_100897/g.195118  ORF Transcript_100897/g.195118 Transcript_100897/m.195118 type:complete len:273 (-) Transcript_100897:102-920(-)